MKRQSYWLVIALIVIGAIAVSCIERDRTSSVEHPYQIIPPSSQTPLTREQWRRIDPAMVSPSTPRQVNDRDLGLGGGGEKLGGKRSDPALPDDTNGERYAATVEHAWIATTAEGGDASTFGLDVDTASYSLIRRHIEQGMLPPVDAVRSEELINAFSYDYAQPATRAEHPFAVTTQIAPCPWQQQHLLLRVAIQGRAISRAERPAMNLVFLVDVSGSMNMENKLPLVQRSLTLLTDQLRADDRVAIVTYAGAERVLLASTLGVHRERIRQAIAGLSANGSTNGEGGIRRAYGEAAKHHAAGVISRVILCTDGDFNVGIRDPQQLKALMAEQARSGIFCNVLGFGDGNYQDANAKAIAANGNGVYAYIDSEREARRVLVDGQGGQLVTIAKDAKCQVFFNPAAVRGWRQIGYEYRRLAREDFSNDRVDAGDIGAGHRVTILYQLAPAGVAIPGETAPPAALTPRENLRPGTLLQVRLRYKKPSVDQSTLIEQEVADRVHEPDTDMRFACAVTEFAMLLRNSPHRGTTTWDAMIARASAARGADADGARTAFIDLARRAAAMAAAQSTSAIKE